MTALERLQFNTREEAPEGSPCRAYTDAQLKHLLRKRKGDVLAASYEALIGKAKNDALQLPEGVTLADRSAYWLRLAALYRPNGSRCLLRADEVTRNG